MTSLMASEKMPVNYLASFDMELYEDSFDLFIEYYVDSSKIKFQPHQSINQELMDYFVEGYLGDGNQDAFNALPKSVQDKLTLGLEIPKLHHTLYEGKDEAQQYVEYHGLILDQHQAERIEAGNFWRNIAKNWDYLEDDEKTKVVQFKYLTKEKKAQYLKLIGRHGETLPLLPQYAKTILFQWDRSIPEIKLVQPLSDIKEVDKILHDVAGKTMTTRSLYDPLHDNGRASIHYHFSLPETTLTQEEVADVFKFIKVKNLFEHLQIGHRQIVYGEKSNRNGPHIFLNSFIVNPSGKGNVRQIQDGQSHIELRESLKNPMGSYSELIRYFELSKDEMYQQIQKDVEALMSEKNILLFFDILRNDPLAPLAKDYFLMTQGLDSFWRLGRLINMPTPGFKKFVYELLVWNIDIGDGSLLSEYTMDPTISKSRRLEILSDLVRDPRLVDKKTLYKRLGDAFYRPYQLPIDVITNPIDVITNPKILKIIMDAIKLGAIDGELTNNLLWQLRGGTAEQRKLFVTALLDRELIPFYDEKYLKESFDDFLLALSVDAKLTKVVKTKMAEEKKRFKECHGMLWVILKSSARSYAK